MYNQGIIMPKILNISQVKKLTHDDKKLKNHSIDSTCSLYLTCFDNGTKIYKMRTKSGYITIGRYEDISLAEARDMAKSMRKEKLGLVVKSKALGECFYEWLDIKIPHIDDEKIRQKRRKQINRINKHILKPLGSKNISEITKQDILDATKGVSLESAKKILTTLRYVFKFARGNGFVKDISFLLEIIEDKRDIFVNKKVEHRKGITNELRLKEIITCVHEARINQVVKNMFFFNLLTAQRPHQIRELTWDRVDLQKGLIYFYEDQNKTGLNVRLPLSKQAIEILNFQRAINDNGKAVFKSPFNSRVSGQAFCDAVLLKTLKSIGINDLHAHGFRATFATFAIRANEGNKAMFEKRVIDEILLHTVGSDVDKAYFRDFNTSEQLRVLQWWDNFLFELCGFKFCQISL